MIAICKDEKNNSANNDFIDLVKQFRSKSNYLPSFEEITEEVEQQRSEM